MVCMDKIRRLQIFYTVWENAEALSVKVVWAKCRGCKCRSFKYYRYYGPIPRLKIW
jgi:hypothetical protein